MLLCALPKGMTWHFAVAVLEHQASAKLVGVPSRLQRLGGIFRFIEVKLVQLLPLPKSVCNVSTLLYKWREFFTAGMLQFLTEMQAKLMNSLGAM